MHPLIAQGIDSVPSDFLKHLVTIILAGVTAWAGYLRGKRATGRADDPVTLAQPVRVLKAAEHASREEMRRIEKRADTTDAKLDDLKETLLKAGDERELRLRKDIKDEVTKLRDEHTRTIESIREQVNAARLKAASNAAKIETLEGRDHHHDNQLSVLLQRPVCGKCSGKPH